jgi:hypothetical protein
MRALVETACLAPSVHNTQPWRWCSADNQLNLYADRTRQLVATDPDGRDLLLSCGAALHHLTVAAAAQDLRARIRRMPDANNDDHIAMVTFQRYDTTPDDVDHLAALRKRRTDRRRPSSWPVPIERLEPMVELAARAGVLALPVTSERARARLLDLTLRAAQVQNSSDPYLEELTSWIAHSPTDGVPWSSLPVSDHPEDPDRGMTLPLTRFPNGSLLESEEDNDEASGAVLLVLATSSDDATSQVRAGEAMSAVLIRGAATAMSMVPLSQAMEVKETRLALQEELLDDVASPQAVIHIGWQPIAEDDVDPSPRRPVDEVFGPCG